MAKLTSVTADRSRLRISYRNNDRRNYFYLDLPNNKNARKLAKEIADCMATDLESGCFDDSLRKYKAHRNLGASLVSGPCFQAFEEWLCHHSKEICRKTIEGYKSLSVDLKTHFGKLPTVDLTRHRCNQFIDYLVAKGNSPYVIKRKIQACWRAWLWLKEYNYIQFNPWHGMVEKIKAPPKNPLEPFTKEERDKLIETCRNRPVYHCFVPFLEFLFYTGVRIGEACGLQWKKISADFTEIVISEQMVKGQLKPTKNGKIRTFKVSPKVSDILLSLKPEKVDPDDLVFKHNNHAIDAANFRQRAWNTLFNHATDIPHRSPYNTRSTFVSMCLAQGMPPIEVAQITGHTVSTMFIYYAGFITKKPTLPSLDSEVK